MLNGGEKKIVADFIQAWQIYTDTGNDFVQHLCVVFEHFSLLFSFFFFLIRVQKKRAQMEEEKL